MHNDITTPSITTRRITLSQTLQIVSAAILGGLIVLSVAFLPMTAAHNAAHDTRHATGFPCH